MQLADLQVRFLNNILDENNNDLTYQIPANGLAATRRFQIYRNNITLGLTTALQAIYPMTQRVVGENFFSYAADRYLHSYPLTSGDLRNYGSHFSQFLRDYTPAQTLPYLPDLANLEWMYHEVFHAADASLLNLTRLSTIAEEQYDSIQFHFHPASRLFSSNFPVLAIWRLCAAQKDEAVDLNDGGVQLLIIRRKLEMYFEPLSKGEFSFLTALSENNSLLAACNCALEIMPDFDLSASLQQHILRGTIVDFSFKCSDPGVSIQNEGKKTLHSC